MSARRPRLLALYVRHGTQKYKEAFPALRALFATQAPNADVQFLIVDNALDAEAMYVEEDGIQVLGGNNESWEFSAWDRAILSKSKEMAAFDLIILVTSAFQQLNTRHLTRINDQMIDACINRAWAVGHIDYRSAPEILSRNIISYWIRTSFLMIPPRELALIGSLVTFRDGESLFSGDAAAPFQEGAPLSQGLRRDIIAWLCGDGLGQGTSWHSRFDLTPDTLPFFEQKARAILNEQALSSRLAAQGCQPVDMTWLATELARAGAPRTIPSWRRQLQSRDMDAIPAELLGP